MMVPVPLRLRKEFPQASLIGFVSLQVLDILTTLLGLQLGARETSFFIGGLMRVGPVAALLMAKLFAVLLVCVAMKFRGPRVVVFLNYWFAAVVSWNLVMILTSLLAARRERLGSS
jgi:hypothetical protein